MFLRSAAWIVSAALVTALPGASSEAGVPQKRARRPAAHRRAAAKPAPLDSQALATQVMLDRAGYSPGEIDGTMGSSSKRALDAFKKNGGDPTSLPTDAITTYHITAQDAAGPFTPDIPSDLMAQSKLDALDYKNLDEALGERFHCSPALLHRLNPGVAFAADAEIKVPNVAAVQPVGPMRGRQTDADNPSAVTVTVHKSTSDLTVTDAQQHVLFYAPVTTGSQHDPLPLGDWKVTGVQHNPKFHYNPALFWDAQSKDTKATIPAGPNNPVGVVWVDINPPPLRHPRHPGALDHRQDDVARLRPHGQLGCRKARISRPAGDARGIRGMKSDRRRPDVRYLVAAGLLGFVLGAFVVGSLGRNDAVSAHATPGAVPNVVATPGVATVPPVTGVPGISAPGAPIDDAPAAVVDAPAAASGTAPALPTASPETAATDLAARKLTIPVQGITASKLVNTYHDARTGNREHEALDILAPRNTPVLAVEDGTIARLFLSKAGGITIYQFDPDPNLLLLLRAPRALRGRPQGRGSVHRAQVLGFVGTTGNAPKDTPHLHFAVFKLTADKHWWEGTPLNPFDILR